jgi:hypothetical protein
MKSASRGDFDAFLAQSSSTSGKPITEAERADLIRAFLEWNRGREPN